MVDFEPDPLSGGPAREFAPRNNLFINYKAIAGVSEALALQEASRGGLAGAYSAAYADDEGTLHRIEIGNDEWVL